MAANTKVSSLYGLNATGTPSSSTFLRGDNSWASAGATAGQVIQVVSTTKTDGFSSTSISFTDITGFSATITPSSTSNKIFVLIHFSVIPYHDSCVKLLRGTTGIYLGDAASGSGGANTQTSTSIANASDGSDHTPVAHALMYLDSPASTSATVYKLQAKIGDTSSGAFYLNKPSNLGYGSIGYLCASSFTLMEIKG